MIDRSSLKECDMSVGLKRNVGTVLRWIVTGLLTTVILGCMGNSIPPAPTNAASSDYNYVIGPGDMVDIVVWRNPELSMTVPVRPDGKIAAPLVEDLPAMGKNATALARDIEKELGKYIRDPVVTVVVTQFVGPYSEQIRVVGEAGKPQTLPYKQYSVRVADLIKRGDVSANVDMKPGDVLIIPRSWF